MIEWYKKVVFENYANFNGRARRSEYWYYTLANTILAILAMILDNVAGLTFGNIGYGPLYSVIALGTIIPGLAVLVRRLHDVGKSGWFFFIILIPIIGSIWLLVLLCTEGESGTNQYGSDPKNEFDEINEIGETEVN
ncbi:Inner membrane protein YhaI [compost metagenome]